MNGEPNTLERAFELAKSGKYISVDEIRRTLKKERYDAVEEHLRGPAINRQLRALCDAARETPAS